MGPLRFTGPNDYVPIAHPGGTSGLDADHPFVRCHFERLIEAGAPIAVMLVPGNAPITPPGVTRASPETLGVVIDLIDELGGALDYVLFDLEGAKAETEHPRHGITVTIRRAVEMVRSHENPKISGARIGNYAWSATRFDRATSFASAAQQDYVADGYLASGADVSMPSCYGYSWRRTHTGGEPEARVRSNLGTIEGEGSVYLKAAPTIRAALLWGGVERLSAAARALPEGHLLIPWFGRFVAWSGYPVGADDLPTWQDCEAMAVHARLRGAHSFLVLPSSYEAAGNAQGKGAFRVDDGGIDNWRYRELLIDAWSALESDFADRPAPEIMRLETDKASGIVVSGVRFGDEVVVAVSNLSGRDQNIDAGEALGVRFNVSPIFRLAHGRHGLQRWKIDAAVRDFDGDGRLTRRDKDAGERRITDAARAGAFEPMLDINGDGAVDLRDATIVRSARTAYGPLPR